MPIRRKTAGRRIKKKTVKRTPRRKTDADPPSLIADIARPEGLPPARYLSEPNLDLRKVLHWVALDAMRMPRSDQARFLDWAREMLRPRLAALGSSPLTTPRGETNTRALMRFVSQEGRSVARQDASQLDFRARIAEAWVQQIIAQIEWASQEREAGLSTDQMTGVVTAIKALLEQDGLLRLSGGEEGA